jgi:ATP-binding cassette subfamily B protein
LAGEFVTVRFDKDAVVFGEGDPGDRFYLIVRGVVEVSRMGEAGERVVAYLEDGDFFGEMALLEGTPRNATVTAVTPTTTLSIDREQFDSMLADVPEIARTIRDEAADRARANGFQ